MRPVLDVAHPLAIAHRGSRLLWPENTMRAFGGAYDIGYRWFETDLHLTGDGVVVCLHDDTLDRTTDRTGPISDVVWADMASIDAGFAFEIEGEHPFRGRGVSIPSFEELVTTYPDVSVVVDLKQDGLARPLAGLVERLDLWDRIVVGSFSDRRLREFREATAGRVATSTGPVASVAALIGALMGRAPRLADAVQLPRSQSGIPVITARSVKGFLAGGYDVHVWTVNDPEEMRLLLDWGVGGIITDRGDLLRQVLEARGAWTGG